MTRLEAASRISAAIEVGDYTTSVWAPSGNAGPVRVYVTIPAKSHKKPAQKIGHVEIAKDGAIETCVAKQSGAIKSLLPEIQVDPVVSAPKPVAAAFASSGDETVDQFKAEQVRELGRTGELPGA